MRDVSAAIRNQPPAVHDYDWAPYHMPGSVQPYGVLLVADPHSRRVLFASDNAEELLGIAAADIIDASYLSLADSERERAAIKERVTPATILFPNPMRLTIRGRPFDAVFHAHAGAHQIEIEPLRDESGSYDDLALRAAAELYDPPSIDDLYQRAVRVVRESTGFDRVMLYRFDPRYNGQVIAESARDGIGSFLGLHFPSGDIAARARELYLQNFTRYIPDIGGRAAGLVGVFPGGGHADSAHPVDMTHSNLRSVAPCHIVYLQNIGVKASMSFSINVDGRLWGLFACHHHAPRHVSYERRVVCEQAAMMFIYRLAQMSSTAARLARRRGDAAALARTLAVGAALQRRLAGLAAEWQGGADEATARALLARAAQALHATSGFLLPMDAAAPEPEPAPSDPAPGAPSAEQRLLLALVEADSAAVVRNGRVRRIGDAPPEMAVYALASMFGRELPDLRGAAPHVFATDCLSAIVPAAESIKDRAAGMMAAALSLDTHAYVLWFRREQVVSATWAGNPAAEAMSAGADGLNPRASFEAWRQDIRNLSRSWVTEDVEVADQLAEALRQLDAPRAPRPAPPVARPHPAAPSPAPAQAAAPEPAAAVGGPRRVIRIGQR